MTQTWHPPLCWPPPPRSPVPQSGGGLLVGGGGGAPESLPGSALAPSSDGADSWGTWDLRHLEGEGRAGAGVNLCAEGGSFADITPQALTAHDRPQLPGSLPAVLATAWPSSLAFPHRIEYPTTPRPPTHISYKSPSAPLLSEPPAWPQGSAHFPLNRAPLVFYMSVIHNHYALLFILFFESQPLYFVPAPTAMRNTK